MTVPRPVARGPVQIVRADRSAITGSCAIAMDRLLSVLC